MSWRWQRNTLRDIVTGVVETVDEYRPRVRVG